MSSYADPRSQVKAPAICLLVLGILNMLIGGFYTLSSFFGTIMKMDQTVFTSEAEEMGYYFGKYGATGIAVFSVLFAPIIIVGAVKMMNLSGYTLAKTAAILTIVPLTSCCCLFTIPFGIWAFLVLGKPEVKAAFLNPSQNFPGGGYGGGGYGGGTQPYGGAPPYGGPPGGYNR